MNKFIATCLLIFLFFPITAARSQSYNDIELVESYPIETTLDDPDVRNALDVWTEMIKGAKHSLDIEQFYISTKTGEPLEIIIKEIIAASERGVKIRVLADARMYKTYPETIDLLNKQKNILARIIDFGKIAGGIQHAKYFIVDGEEMFLGSQNFDWRALKHIHELGVRVRNKNIADIFGDVFEIDWKLSDKNDAENISSLINHKKYNYPITLIGEMNDTISIIPTMSPISAIPDTSLWDENWIVQMIDEAKKEVLCQFLTYSPLARDKKYYAIVDNALRRAAVRGVKVKMIVSDWSKDHPTVDHLKSLSLVPNIEIKFSSIPEWSGGYIPFARVDHCKYLVIDSARCWIGTSNCEKSYFYTSRNLGLYISNNLIAQKAKKIFYLSWNSDYTESIKPEVEYLPREHGER
jgi:phosphatidylserine/phosphatidylglycerophosphate/cardiolipin synthase-like enzyme